jgi:hypothetical protein
MVSDSLPCIDHKSFYRVADWGRHIKLYNYNHKVFSDYQTYHTYAILFNEDENWDADWFALTVVDYNGNFVAQRNFYQNSGYAYGEMKDLKACLEYSKSYDINEGIEHLILRGTIQSVTLNLESEKAVKDFTESVVHFVKTPVWGNYGAKGYVTQYPTAVFVGSSITLNDLQYSPDVTGHRLFMKSDSFK